MSNDKYEIKNDRYAKSRGGHSRLLDIICVKCDERVVLYQKDGQGGLVRLYLNRIFEPAEIAKLQFEDHSKSTLPDLKCQKCKTLIATPMLYEQDGRLALRLIRGTYLKKKHVQ
jgi:ribosomal protein S27E